MRSSWKEKGRHLSWVEEAVWFRVAAESALYLLDGWQRKTSADKCLEMVFCVQVLWNRPVTLAALTWCSQCRVCMHTEHCPLMCSALGSCWHKANRMDAMEQAGA